MIKPINDYIPIKSFASWGSVLGFLMLLIYSKGFRWGLSCTTKLFVDDMSIFSLTDEPNKTDVSSGNVF